MSEYKVKLCEVCGEALEDGDVVIPLRFTLMDERGTDPTLVKVVRAGHAHVHHFLRDGELKKEDKL